MGREDGVSDGDLAARCSLRSAIVGQEPGIHRRRGADAGFGCRRQHGTVFRRRCRSAATAAVSATRTAGRRERRHAGRKPDRRWHVAARAGRFPALLRSLRSDLRRLADQRQHYRPREAGAGGGQRGQHQLLHPAGSQARTGPRLYRSRFPRRILRRRGHQRQPVAQDVRRRSECVGAECSPRHRPVHDHRRHAAGVSSSRTHDSPGRGGLDRCRICRRSFSQASGAHAEVYPGRDRTSRSRLERRSSPGQTRCLCRASAPAISQRLSGHGAVAAAGLFPCNRSWWASPASCSFCCWPRWGRFC